MNMKKFCLFLLKIIIAVFIINFIVMETFITSHYLTSTTIIIIYSISAFSVCCMLLGWSIFSYSKIFYVITISSLIVFFSLYHFLPQIVDAHIQQHEIEGN